MKTVTLKFTRAIVEKVDLRKNSFNMAFLYEEDSKPMKLQKTYRLDEDVNTFADNVISAAKLKSRETHSVKLEEDDALSYYINIVIEDENAREKLVNAMKRFKDKVRDLKSLGRHESYIQRYNSLLGLKAEL